MATQISFAAPNNSSFAARMEITRLERWPGITYSHLMASTLNDTEAPADWLDSLDRSQTQAEAGETVPLEPVLGRLRASIARMKAKRSEENPQAAHKA